MMAYTSEMLIWQVYEIEVRYDPDPFSLVSCHQEAMAHVEIRTLKPENAPLPITETGYRSHFTPKGNIDKYDSAVDFARAWLDHEGQCKEWKTVQEEARQLSLF